MTPHTYVTVVIPLVVLAIGCILFGLGRLVRRSDQRARERRALVLDIMREQQPMATGYTLSVELEERTGRRFFIASIYETLIELEREGVIASRWGEATAARGWRRPRHYWIVADMPHLVPGED